MTLTERLDKQFGKGRWIVSDAPAKELKRLGFKHRCTVQNWIRVTSPLDFKTRLDALTSAHYESMKGLKGRELADYIQKNS